MLIDTIISLKAKCCLEEEIGEDFNLSTKELSCIFSLYKHEFIHSKELSNKINLSPSRGSRIINRLIKKGYVIETHDLEDKRFLNLSLSEDGKQIYERVKKKRIECENRLLSKLDNQQKKVVKKGLEILIGAM